jgi:hypothetical protein
MKTILLTLSLFIGLQMFGQTKANVTGVWQWSLNGKMITAGDLGYTNQYSHYFAFQVFTAEDKMYLVLATSIDGVSRAKLSDQIAKQFAMAGSYNVNENAVAGTIDGTPFNFDFDPKSKRLVAPNPDMKVELIYKKVF